MKSLITSTTKFENEEWKKKIEDKIDYFFNFDYIFTGDET